MIVHEARSATEVARHFADYINRVAYRGERFVLVEAKEFAVDRGLSKCNKRPAYGRNL